MACRRRYIFWLSVFLVSSTISCSSVAGSKSEETVIKHDILERPLIGFIGECRTKLVDERRLHAILKTLDVPCFGNISEISKEKEAFEDYLGLSTEWLQRLSAAKEILKEDSITETGFFDWVETYELYATRSFSPTYDGQVLSNYASEYDTFLKKHSGQKPPDTLPEKIELFIGTGRAISIKAINTDDLDIVIAGLGLLALQDYDIMVSEIFPVFWLHRISPILREKGISTPNAPCPSFTLFHNYPIYQAIHEDRLLGKAWCNRIGKVLNSDHAIIRILGLYAVYKLYDNIDLDGKKKLLLEIKRVSYQDRDNRVRCYAQDLLKALHENN